MKAKIILILIILAAPALVSLAQTATPEPYATQTPYAAVPPDAIAGATNAAAASTNAVAAPASAASTGAASTSPAAAAPANTAESEPVAESLSFDDLPLPDAIRQLARLADLNIQFDPRLFSGVGPNGAPIAPPTVKEKWKNVTAMQALLALLDNYGLQIEREPKNPIVRITAKDPKALEALITTVIQLNYSEPTNIMQEVKATLSERSSIFPDARTHQLVLRTTEKELAAAQKLIASLDSATRQVLIEAKIIETTKDLTSAKGIDWTGTLASQHISFGNGLTGGTVSSGSTTASQGNSVANPNGRVTGVNNTLTTVVSNSSSFVTSIAGTPSAAGGFSMNTANGISPATAFLNADGVSAVLSFLNTDADSRTVSFPRTVSLDGVKNELMAVQNVPIFEQQQSAPSAGASQGLATVKPNYDLMVENVILNEVGVKLAVTPRIAGPSNVLITVQPEISSVDAVIATSTLSGQVSTSPIFDRRRLLTQASVPSGCGSLTLASMPANW